MFRHFAAALLLLAGLAACDRGPDIDDEPIEPTIEPAAPGEDVAPQEPMTAPAYHGVWAAAAEWCAIAPGSGDPSPIAFTETEFIGYENLCRVGKSVEGTEGGFQLELFCEAEGVEYQENIELDVDGEMLRLRREDGGETTFVRCEETE